MPRSLVLLLTLVLAVASAPAAPRPKDKERPKPYYATVLGTTLVYDDGGTDRTQEVTAVEEKDGETLVTVSDVSAGGKAPLEKVSISARGVFRVASAEFKFYPLCTLRFPVRENDTWEYDLGPQKGLAGQAGTVTVGGVEAVETPAGTFKAVRVELVVRTVNGRKLDPPQAYTQWFDPDVGLVKLTGGTGFTRVLKSVTRPAKKD
jgi:hypothetical protein